MDKFINKDGKIVLEIDDTGEEKKDQRFFEDMEKLKKKKKELEGAEEDGIKDPENL